LTLYCLDASVVIEVRIPLDQDEAIKLGTVGLSELLASGAAGYNYRPGNEKLKEGCRYFDDLSSDGTEVISDHQSGTDFPIEFRKFSKPGGLVTTRYCIDFDMHILIPRQEQGVPYDRKTPPMSEAERNLQQNNPPKEQTNE
jgi:hypothetical protein